MSWKQHPLSAAFPVMPEDDLLALAEDIKENGLKEKVVMFEGMVLDGWHRCQGCQIAQVDIQTREFPADKDPVAYVISKNAHRRHLSASQRAAAVVACHEWATPSDNQYSESAHEPGSPPPATNQQMAQEAGTTVRTIQQAKTAEKAGLGDAVRNGEKSAKQAAAEARGQEPKEKKPTPLEAAQQKIESLTSQVSELKLAIAELTDNAQSELDAQLPENEQAVAFAKLRQEKRVLESQLNEQKQLTVTFQREVKALRRRLGD